MAILGLCCYAWAFSTYSERVYSVLWCRGFSLQWLLSLPLLLLQSTGSRLTAAAVAAYRLRCCGACVWLLCGT